MIKFRRMCASRSSTPNVHSSSSSSCRSNSHVHGSNPFFPTCQVRVSMFLHLLRRFCQLHMLGTPEHMPKRMPNTMPERMSNRMPERMPDRMAEHISERMSECMSDRRPERMPNRMSEHMPDRMSERVPNKMQERMSE